MAGALLVYFLCILSGVLLERRFPFNNLLKRVIIILAAAAGQLMLSIEFLSLWRGLTGIGLLLANGAMTGMTFGVLARTAAPNRNSWSILMRRALVEVLPPLKDPLSAGLVVAGAGMFAIACIAAAIMIPFNDSYHFEMPLFWIQNHSVLPFIVPNPRIVALSFLSEALQLPGYLYAQLRYTPAIATFFSGLLVLWVIFSLARRIGASLAASICASAITSGYTIFAINCFHCAPEMFLAGFWFGASLLFLMDYYATPPEASFCTAEIGASVFCFLMACGAKNTITLTTPMYLVFLALALARGRGLQILFEGPGHSSPASLTSAPAEPGPPGSTPAAVGLFHPQTRKILSCIGLCGLAGLLCSGIAWNYASNKLWFGHKGLPKLLSGTVSSDFHPRAIWTRICRGAVLMAYDTIWIPRSARETYVSLCNETVMLLGGQKQMQEDAGHYCFNEEAPTPLKGLGLLGIAFFLPGVVSACLRLLSWGGSKVALPPFAKFNIMLLVLATIGSFLLCHLVLRWQSLGVLRLMFPFVIAGAPLAALVLENAWLRAFALLLLLTSGAMFSTYWLGNISRRLDWADRPVLKLISRLQNSHALTVEYQWKGQPASRLRIREDYTFREAYETLLQGVRQPCKLGFIGNVDSECFYLFGQQFQNRVVPLVDARDDGRILSPPSDLDYVVAAFWYPEARAWAEANGFEEVFTMAYEHEQLVLAFQKKP